MCLLQGSFCGRCPLDSTEGVPSTPASRYGHSGSPSDRPSDRLLPRGRHKVLSPGSTAKAHRGSPVRLASATTNFPSTTLTPVLRSFMREGLSVTQTTAIQGLATDLDVLAGVRHHHAPPHPLSRVSMHDSRRTAEPCMHDPRRTAVSCMHDPRRTAVSCMTG